MTLVKVCGLTRREDALRAVEYGADALGFVFAPRSRRRADPEEVARMVEDLPPQTVTVGVFQDQPEEQVRDIVLGCGLAVAQLHGSEDRDYATRLGVPVLKAFGLSAREDVAGIERYGGLEVALLDSAQAPTSPGTVAPASGGTGRAFDWAWLEGVATPPRVVLGGGIHPGNVARALEQVRPWAVDAASGTESEPGRKDHDRLRAFIFRARRVGQREQEGGGRSPCLHPEDQVSGWGQRFAPSFGAGGTQHATCGRLQAALRRRRAAGGKCFVPFFLGGYPDRTTFGRLLEAAQTAGADAVEVGVPSPDPALDGPVIREASRVARSGGACLGTVLADIASARAAGFRLPIVLMMYAADGVHREGADLPREARRHGVDALLLVHVGHQGNTHTGGVPADGASAGEAPTLENVSLVEASAPAVRYRELSCDSPGFVYCVPVSGPTGGEPASAAAARPMVERVRRHTDAPVLLGFGIKDEDTARSLAAVSDGVVVGSALVELLRWPPGAAGEDVAAATRLLHGLRRAVDEAGRGTPTCTREDRPTADPPR